MTPEREREIRAHVKRAKRDDDRCDLDPADDVGFVEALDLLAEIDRLRMLPVLSTCGDCGWLSSAMERAHPVCDHPLSLDKRTARGRDASPATWCPLRGAR